MTERGFIRWQNSSTNIRVGKIICVGRNYPAHAKEMNATIPEKPVLFLKPPSAIVWNGGMVRIPSFGRDLHHEVEMVVLIGAETRRVKESEAMRSVSGYAVGMDMTLRDVQSEAKKMGLPWTMGKGFDTAAPVSEFVEALSVRDPHNLAIGLKVNGETRQSSNTRHMLFRIDALIGYISSIMTLESGDLIFTGTPEGVGSVREGDIIQAELESVGSLTVTVGV
jgi:5-carboxymethyl-2-hydroxymuconate isomerase